MKARNAYVRLRYKGGGTMDITEESSGCTIVDCASGEADTISVSLFNKSGKWFKKNYFPKSSDYIRATIVVDKWKNDYYKVFADMENIKRRMQNEHANNLKFMMQGFIEQMLPIVDNFERSLAIENPSEEVANFLKGYEMIYKQIMTLLENQGVKVIEAEGKEFDPNFHQAVMTVSDENFKPGMVVEELQKGYMLKDRVIRASLVKVSE